MGNRGGASLRAHQGLNKFNCQICRGGDVPYVESPAVHQKKRKSPGMSSKKELMKRKRDRHRAQITNVPE